MFHFHSKIAVRYLFRLHEKAKVTIGCCFFEERIVGNTSLVHISTTQWVHRTTLVHMH